MPYETFTNARLIPAARQVELAGIIAAGERSRVICPDPDMMEKADKAVAELAESGLPLLIPLAQGLLGRLPADDILQEGALGVTHAARVWDPEQGTKFELFSLVFARRYMIRALAESSGMGIPEHVRKNRSKLIEVVTEFMIDHGREPTEPELVAGMGLPDESKSYRLVRGLIRMPMQVSLEGWCERHPDLEPPTEEGDLR